MKIGYRILDFRNRPPLPAYASLFELRRKMLGNPLKRTALECWFRWLPKSLLALRNAAAAMTTELMQTDDPSEAMRLWWQEIYETDSDTSLATVGFPTVAAASTAQAWRSCRRSIWGGS